ncbi:hypothetical protein EOD42_23085 [Rhodovarius crocodyli]|uniref:Peptidase C14 caspase domain-containing protein n=1 Tax=Rhodovarius crocodyli TaxID=1979269 RepID=A0A437LZ52_9PROT|nr:caspase family protein [Rhodovarius crocodyli]RVT90690.1 hypothetical protein EOD42_23085 [Rhodovarius crocodyli]
MRKFSRRAALAGLAGAAAPALAQTGNERGLVQASQQARAVHALVVGINNYRISPLRGCVNDAQLLAAAVRPFVASTTVLLDEQATRANFLAAWRQVTARCGAGDMVFFSFSGHGFRIPETVPGSEDDGMDDVIAFQPLHPQQAPTELLVDNEIEVMFAEQGRRRVSVMFVADCCHSGTLTRSVDPLAAREVRYRTMTGSFPPSQMRGLVPPAPPTPPPSQLTQVHFFAASLETEPVPEITFQGSQHGALSIAIAAGFARGAVGPQEAVVALPALATEAVQTVRALVDARQNPQIALGTEGPRLLRGLVSPRPQADNQPREVRIRMEGALGGALPEGARRAGPLDPADLIWRANDRVLVSPLGDMISAEIGQEQLPMAVERQRALWLVQEATARQPLELRLELMNPPAGSTAEQRRAANADHPLGTRLKLVVEQLRFPNFVMFNIAGNGTVQMLYPQDRETPTAPPGGRMVLDDVVVRPPLGADHVVALCSNRPLTEVAQRLIRLDETKAPMQAVRLALDGLPEGGWQIGLVGLFRRRA